LRTGGLIQLGLEDMRAQAHDFLLQLVALVFQLA
jgi:hypothetical protein